MNNSIACIVYVERKSFPIAINEKNPFMIELNQKVKELEIKDKHKIMWFVIYINNFVTSVFGINADTKDMVTIYQAAEK